MYFVFYLNNTYDVSQKLCKHTQSPEDSLYSNRLQVVQMKPVAYTNQAADEVYSFAQKRHYYQLANLNFTYAEENNSNRNVLYMLLWP